MFRRLLLASSTTIALSFALAPSAFATITQASPHSSSTYVGSVAVVWSTTTQASSLSMVWTYTSGPYASTEDGQQITLNFANPGSAMSGSFVFSPASPTSSSSIASVSGPFYDGTYSEVLREVQASNSVTVSSATITNVTLDFETVPPTLTAPVVGSSGNTLPVAFDLPQPPSLAAGTVQLSLTNQSTNAVTTLDLPSTQDQSFTLSPGNLGGGSSATVASGPSSLADGTYSVVLSYANQYGNPDASSTPFTWTLDTTTQTPPAPSVTGGTDGSDLQISYDLPEAATPGAVELVFTGPTTTIVSLTDQTAGSHTLTLDPSGLSTSSDVAATFPVNASLPDGSYTVVLAYQDALGNPSATSALSGLTVSPMPASTTTPPTTTPTPPTPTPPTPAPTPVLAPVSVTLGAFPSAGLPVMNSGKVALTLICPASATGCDTSGVLVIHLSKVLIGSSARLPAVSFSGQQIAGGHSALVAVNLNPGLLRRLQSLRIRRVKVTLTISNHLTGGSAAVTTDDVYLRIPPLGAQECPVATGQLASATLGPFTLGITREHARQLIRDYAVRNYRSDNFCLFRANGIRVGYGSRELLGTASGAADGKLILALSANHYYTIDGIRPGETLSAAARKAHLSPVVHAGLNNWYIIPGATTNGVLKVRHGLVKGVGIVTKSLTSTHAQQLHLLRNF